MSEINNYDQYIVSASGSKDGKSYSSLLPVRKGLKPNGDRYAYIDTQAFPVRRDVEMPFLKIVYSERTFIEPETTSNTKLKINQPG